jgi:hypothetical protein
VHTLAVCEVPTGASVPPTVDPKFGTLNLNKDEPLGAEGDASTPATFPSKIRVFLDIIPPTWSSSSTLSISFRRFPRPPPPDDGNDVAAEGNGEAEAKGLTSAESARCCSLFAASPKLNVAAVRESFAWEPTSTLLGTGFVANVNGVVGIEGVANALLDKGKVGFGVLDVSAPDSSVLALSCGVAFFVCCCGAAGPDDNSSTFAENGVWDLTGDANEKTRPTSLRPRAPSPARVSARSSLPARPSMFPTSAR